MAEEIKKLLKEQKTEIIEEVSRRFGEALGGAERRFGESLGGVERRFNSALGGVERRFGVLAERLEDDIRIVGEGVETNTTQIQGLTEQVGANTETLEAIKLDVTVIKSELTGKVGLEKFALLERKIAKK